MSKYSLLSRSFHLKTVEQKQESKDTKAQYLIWVKMVPKTSDSRLVYVFLPFSWGLMFNTKLLNFPLIPIRINSFIWIMLLKGTQLVTKIVYETKRHIRTSITMSKNSLTYCQLENCWKLPAKLKKKIKYSHSGAECMTGQ